MRCKCYLALTSLCLNIVQVLLHVDMDCFSTEFPLQMELKTACMGSRVCGWVGVCVFHCVSALFQCGQGDNSLDLWFNTVLCTVECVGVCMMRHRGVQIYLRMKSCGM